MIYFKMTMTDTLTHTAIAIMLSPWYSQLLAKNYSLRSFQMHDQSFFIIINFKKEAFQI
jgi:hypothetical protein